LERWNQWDGPHYLDIARDGYVNTDLHSKDQRLWIVFYPLFPWTIRFVTVVLRDYLLSAHVITLAGAVATALIFQRLAELDFERKTARAAVFFMFIFPTAYFFHAVYTESLFMPLMLGCVLAARERRWGVAGGLGALASLARVNGLLLVPVMLIEAFAQYREEGRRFRREWLWIPVAGAGFLVYLFMNYRVQIDNPTCRQDAFCFQKILSQFWFKKLTWPWVGIGKTLEWVWSDSPSQAQLVGTQEFCFIALSLICTLWCWRRLRTSYAVWMTLNWLLVTSTAFIMSTPRYVLSFFPIFLLFAGLAARRPFWGALLTVWSLAFFALFAGQFAIGQWAF
jgi:Gpi18-like mannosyltransferase